jgi:4'-phosphopantetheinyl transferase
MGDAGVSRAPAGGADPGTPPVRGGEPLAPGELRVVMASLGGGVPGDAPGTLACRAAVRADARALLLRLLAGVSGVPEGELVLRVGRHGKPFLAGGDGLHFNLTHSRGRAAVAVTRVGPVGIDLEHLDPERAIGALLARTFSAAEQEGVALLPPEARIAAFFQGWTRKEAFVKAVGRGLGYPLREVEFEAGPGGRLLRVGGEAAGGRWRVYDLPLPPEARGAVVVEGAPGSFAVVEAG